MNAVLLLVVLLVRAGQSEPMFEWILSMSPAQYSGAYEAAYNMLGWRDQQTMANMERARSMNKLQAPVPASVAFPCDVTRARSAVRPISVHALRPGDIDVVGAMGDSVTAAFGGTATDVMHAVVANRGISWSAGGLGSWREFLTLPNILKEFNPNLIGYSLGDSLAWHKRAQFNTAEGWAFSSDMLHQARLLVKRMRSDDRVDFNDDWKVVTMLFGSNDFCYNLCESNLTHVELLENHRNDLTLVLDFLRDNLPRTLVNLVVSPSMMKMQQFTHKPVLCRMTNSFQCPCVLGLSYQANRNIFEEVVTAWQILESELGNSPRYHNKEDFSVVVQPFLKDMPLMKKVTEIGDVPDFSYYSADCMHYSQKGNAMLANGLWNNLLEPVGQKTTRGTTELLKPFHCPTPDHPFIYTPRNSYVQPFVNYGVISPRTSDQELANDVIPSKDSETSYINYVINSKNVETNFNNDVINLKNVDTNFNNFVIAPKNVETNFNNDVINSKNVDTNFNNFVIAPKNVETNFNNDVINSKNDETNFNNYVTIGSNRERNFVGDDIVGTNSELQYDRDFAIVKRRVNDRALDPIRAESNIQSISLRRPVVQGHAGITELDNTTKHSFVKLRGDGSTIRVSLVPTTVEGEVFDEIRGVGGTAEPVEANKHTPNFVNRSGVVANGNKMDGNTNINPINRYGRAEESTVRYNNLNQRSLEASGPKTTTARDTEDIYRPSVRRISVNGNPLNNSKTDAAPKGRNVNVPIDSSSDFENTFFGIARSTLRTGGQIFREFVRRLFAA